MPPDASLVATMVLDCPSGSEYPEPAFRYFLNLERARAGRSERPLRLLFATIERVPGRPTVIPPAGAGRLFKCLRLSLRDTDITGWYRQGRVAAAVLAGSRLSHSNDIEQRVATNLRRHLPARFARSVRVRVVEIDPQRVAIS